MTSPHRPAGRLLGVILLLALTLLSSSTVPPAAADAGAELDRYRVVHDTPGVAVAVFDDDGVEVRTSGRDGAGSPVTAQTRFRVGSVSKSVTATAVMLLVERGAFALDDPVADTLTEFTLRDERFRQITVRQLLSHTSGLSLQTNDEYALPAPGSAQEAVRRIRTATLVAAPGERFEYHNTNYAIAARLVEVASGRSFSQFVNEEVFGPLGMADSVSTDGCADVAPGLDRGYLVVLGISVAAPEMPGMCVGSGGVVSTVEDMATWAQFHRGRADVALLSPDSLAELHRPQPGAGSYALGWQRDPVSPGSPVTVTRHGGTLTTWTTEVMLDPERGGVVVLTNSVGSPGELATNLIADRLGVPRVEYSNPYQVINLVLLGLALLATALLVLTIARAGRWADRRRAAQASGRRALVLPRLVPLSGLAVLGALLPMLAFGLPAGPLRLSSWVVTIWLLPLLALLATVCAALGSAAVISRVLAYRRAGRVLAPAAR